MHPLDLRFVTKINDNFCYRWLLRYISAFLPLFECFEGHKTPCYTPYRFRLPKKSAYYLRLDRIMHPNFDCIKIGVLICKFMTKKMTYEKWLFFGLCQNNHNIMIYVTGFRFVDSAPCVNGTWSFLFYSDPIFPAQLIWQVSLRLCDQTIFLNLTVLICVLFRLRQRLFPLINPQIARFHTSLCILILL